MQRRDLLKLGASSLAASLHPALASTSVAGEPADQGTPNTTEQWGLFEVALQGPASGNPFKDTTLSAVFTQGHRSVQVRGFYDGLEPGEVQKMIGDITELLKEE